MHSLNDSTRGYHGNRTSLTAGLSVMSILSCLLFTSALYAQPGAPTGLTATGISSSQINLSWSAAATGTTRPDSFVVKRSTTSGSGYTRIFGTTDSTTTTYSNTGLSENTIYYYVVTAWGGGSESVNSTEASATTELAAPTALSATTFSNTRIDLAWTDVSTANTGYKVELSSNGGSSYTEIGTTGGTGTSFNATGLTPATTYHFRVTAFTGTSSSPTNTSSSITANATTLPDAPSAPSSLTVVAVSNTQIDLAWTDNSSNEDGFKIERKLSSDVTYMEITTVGANVTTYNNTLLTANTTYNYRVRAFNTGGNSSYSNADTATTQSNPPSAPSGLTATAVSNSQINLAWTDGSSDETGFIIQRKTGAAGTYATIATVGANVISYSNMGLTGSTQYFYQVFATNAGGNSAASNEANATTNVDPPAAPSNLTATTISNSQINLAWTDNANSPNGEDGFKIEIKVGATGTFTQIATVGANTVTYSSAGLDPATQYYYRVRAFNVTDNSPYSNEDTAMTLPDPPLAPSSLSANAVTNSQINLAWTDNSNNEGGFKIERKLTTEVTFVEITSVGAGVTTYSNTGLTANTGYDYRVRAYNTGGNSAYSNIASVITNPNAPAAPSALDAVAAGVGQIDLSWTDNASNETGFQIERSTSFAGTYTVIATTGANVQTYSNTGLAGNTEYFYRVLASNAGGNSAYSNIDSATTLTDPPAAPSNLFASAISNSQINLTWTDNATNEDGFIIKRSIVAGGPYTSVDTVDANETTYSNITGLAGSTQYYYVVGAYNATGNSAQSNEASATTLPDPPAAPSNLTFSTVGNTQVNLAWQDNSNNEFGFAIERKDGAAGTYAAIDSVGANTTTFSNTGLTPGMQYFYRVYTFNSGGNSAYSNEVDINTPSTIPLAPSNLTATPMSSSQINLAWTDNSNNEGGFKIERRLLPSGTFAQITTVGANVATYANTGLPANTGYEYRVRAYNSGGNSSYSNPASATTLPNPPAAPTGLAVTVVSNTQINLSWTDNGSNETAYLVERKTGAAGTYAQIASLGANATSYSDNGLTGNTEYFYRVYASNAGGPSSYSNEASGITPPNPPAAPTALTATPVSNSQINLVWTDNASNEDNYTVERKTGSGGTYAVIATLAASTTSYFNTGLVASTQYFYRVRAANTGGNSAYSNEANATTLTNPPAVPSNLTATAVSSSQINLTWIDNATNENGFLLERKIGATGTYAQIASLAANVVSYSDGGLMACTTYYYRLRVFNVDWTSPYSDEANATTTGCSLLAPSGLAATVISKNQINLAWTDNASNEVGFKIERKTGTGSFSEIASVGAGVTTFSNTGLTANTSFTYQVRAYNANGNSAYSNQVTARTFKNPPAKPTSLVATAASSSQINLTWTDGSTNEDGFKIERSASATGPFTEIAQVGANVTTYSNTGLTASTQYFYQVRAYNNGGNSAYSNIDDATTPSSSLNPPSNLTATVISKNQINLAWTDNSNNETGFKIERKTGTGTFTQIATVGAGVTTYSNTGLTANTGYTYRVRAHTATTNSAYSNSVTATTFKNPPAKPTSLVATATSSSQINLTWTDGSTNENGFKIERSASATGPFTEIAQVGANVTTYSNTGLTASTQYFYQVRAYNNGGNSAYSNIDDATTSSSGLNPPSNLTATVISKNQINLAWTDNSNNETGFKIERKTGTGTFTQIATAGAGVTTYSNTGLTANTGYTYRVRAHTATTNSAYSNSVTATTFKNPPAKPTSLVATVVSSSQINLTWTDGATNEDGFKIERKTGAGTYAEIAQVGANIVNYSNTGLAGGTQYSYRVRAYNNGGTSVYSNEATATTTSSSAAKASQGDKSQLEVMAEAAPPESIVLEQNYPNPFNPSTTIAYSLSEDAQVTLKVINVTGREVATLVDGYQGRGTYRVTFNGRKLPSGTYYAILKAGEVTQVKRMVLAK